jgi:hypothetical protein
VSTIDASKERWTVPSRPHPARLSTFVAAMPNTEASDRGVRVGEVLHDERCICHHAGEGAVSMGLWGSVQ